MSDEGRRLDKETTKKAGGFLFDTPSDESKALDMRTIIKSDKMMKNILYYGGMSELFDSEAAKQIKDLMERLLISDKGIAREQAVETLKQNFPKRIEVDKGSDNAFNEYE